MTEPKQVVRAWVEAFNRADVEALSSMYEEAAMNHQVAQEPVIGRKAIRKMFEREFAAADMVCIVENLFQDGEWAILEWRDPKGLRGCGFFHVPAGRIRFQRGYWDKLSFLKLHGIQDSSQSASNVPITHVSDTALLVAGCRAIEAERLNALVRDPFAARLAGDRGLAMYRALPHPEIMGFGIALRTRFIDELIVEAVSSAGLGTVVCVGSGLDTRPWRLDLPSALRWIEVDFPTMLDYKDQLLAGETPRCRRECLAIDLNDPAQRARLYASVGGQPALMLTEGLLMYLPAKTVHALASEAAGESGIAHWICDLVTTSFTQAIGGGGSKVVRHVQADDHLTGEQTLETLHSHGWQAAARRSYITDLSFASERIKELTARASSPPEPPPFETGDPSGVHWLRKG